MGLQEKEDFQGLFNVILHHRFLSLVNWQIPHFKHAKRCCLEIGVLQLFAMNQEIRLRFENGFDNVYLGYLNIQDQNLPDILNRPTDHLVRFSIWNNNISSNGLLHISKANWKNIVQLSLSQNQVGALGCKYLTRASMPKLQQLYLSKNEIGSGGAAHLLKGRWKQLSKLYMWNARLADGSIKSLIKGDWRYLIRLSMSSNEVAMVQLSGLALAQFDKLQICPQIDKFNTAYQQKLLPKILQKWHRSD